jgi:uncharacterized lipoprotein YddW (UPF0748 family)
MSQPPDSGSDDPRWTEAAVSELIEELERKSNVALAASTRLLDSGDARDGAYQEGYADALDWVIGKLENAEAKVPS